MVWFKNSSRVNLSNSTVNFAWNTNNRGYVALNNWNLHFHGPCGKGVWSLEVSFYHQSCCRKHFQFSWLQPLLWSQHLSHSCNKEPPIIPSKLRDTNKYLIKGKYMNIWFIDERCKNMNKLCLLYSSKHLGITLKVWGFKHVSQA